jgi:YkoP domain
MSAMLHREGYAPSFGTDRFSEVGSAARGAGGKLDRDGITSSHRHWLERLVFGLDSVLRRWQSIIEYSRDPNCILRIKLERLDSDIVVADGTFGRAGDRIVDLHLWNERIPRIPKQGASIAWAGQMHLCFRHSLRELARYLAARSDLDDVSVVRCNMALGGRERNAQMVRLIGRYGFEPGRASAAPTVADHVRHFGENILISLMVLARNAGALRRDTLRRGRTQVFLSRRVLEQRYGCGACPGGRLT